LNYKDLNDFEIIYCIRENNEEANELMFNKYKPLIDKIVQKFFKYASNIGLDKNDLSQEAMLAFSSAIQTFDTNKETIFFTYAKSCVEKRMISLLIKNKALKHKYLNESLPFETGDEESGHFIYEKLLSDNKFNPENKLLDDEFRNLFLSIARENLTGFELKVFEIKINGFSYGEIADILKKDKKSIDNALQRIKAKLKDALKTIDNK